MAILYKANETDFNHLGLGPLDDAVSILVTEERNGMFELEMSYPIEGTRINEIKLDRLIKADAGHNLKGQRFKIIRITKPIDGIVTINAEHVSYLTQDLSLKPTVNYSGTASQALNTWNNNLVDDSPFIVTSDIATTGSGSWSIKDVNNAREALGGVSGSILETYGGEYRFDNYSIRLMAQRGVNSGALIAYGRNLVDLTQEESIADTFTSVYPYASNKEQLLTLPEYFVDSEYVGNYARRKILPVDFSEDEIKDVATLRSRTNSYIKSNGIGIPKVNMQIKYIDLAKTLDYKDLAILEEVNLCDNIFVYFEQLDVNTSAKIIKTVWDDLLEQYDSIEVGEAKSSLSNSINSTVDGKLETIVKRVNTIQLTADGLNVIYRGPEEPAPGNIRDLWYEPDGIYENMYQWDGSIWKLMLSTRELDKVSEKVKEHTDEIVTVTQSANDAVTNAKIALDAFNDIEISGRNLIKNSQQLKLFGNASGWGNSVLMNDESIPHWHITGDNFISTYETLIYDWLNTNAIVGNSYTIGVDVRVPVVGEVEFDTNMGTTFIEQPNVWTRIFHTFEYVENYYPSGLNYYESNEMDYRNWKLETGKNGSDWSPAFEDMATLEKFSTLNATVDGIQTTVVAKAEQTQVTQLANQWTQTTDLVNGHTGQITNLGTDINLRVKKDELLSQINVQSNNILVQSGKLYLDATSVVFSGSAFIPSAAIASLTVDKLNGGIADFAKFNAININADSIVSGTLKSITIRGSVIYASEFRQDDTSSSLNTLVTILKSGIWAANVTGSLTVQIDRAGIVVGGTSTIGSQTRITNNEVITQNAFTHNLTTTGATTLKYLTVEEQAVFSKGMRFAGTSSEAPTNARTIWFGTIGSATGLWCRQFDTSTVWKRLAFIEEVKYVN